MHTFRHQALHGGIDNLSLSYKPSDGISWYRDSFVLAVDDHLLLRHRWTCGIGGGRAIPWFAEPYDAAKLCPHTGPLAQFAFTNDLDIASGHAVVNRAKFDKGGEYDKGLVYKIKRCSACPTEIFIEILPSRIIQGNKRSISSSPRALRISRYIDLGPCNTPGDREWLALTGQTQYPAEDFALRPSIAKRLGEDIWNRPAMVGWPTEGNGWKKVARLDVERQKLRASAVGRLKLFAAQIFSSQESDSNARW
jgi:hypothetical protein